MTTIQKILAQHGIIMPSTMTPENALVWYDYTVAEEMERIVNAIRHRAEALGSSPREVRAALRKHQELFSRLRNELANWVGRQKQARQAAVSLGSLQRSGVDSSGLTSLLRQPAREKTEPISVRRQRVPGETLGIPETTVIRQRVPDVIPFSDSRGTQTDVTTSVNRTPTGDAALANLPSGASPIPQTPSTTILERVEWLDDATNRWAAQDVVEHAMQTGDWTGVSPVTDDDIVLSNVPPQTYSGPSGLYQAENGTVFAILFDDQANAYYVSANDPLVMSYMAQKPVKKGGLMPALLGVGALLMMLK